MQVAVIETAACCHPLRAHLLLQLLFVFDSPLPLSFDSCLTLTQTVSDSPLLKGQQRYAPNNFMV